MRKTYAKEIRAAFVDEWAEAIVTILNAAPELLSLLDERAKEIERLRDALRRIADPSVVCAHTFVPQIGCVHAIATAALKEKP
jgi:hypothetical protein